MKTKVKPTPRALAAARARDTRITKSLRSIEASYQAQIDELQDRRDAVASWQRAGYVKALLDTMQGRLRFRSSEVLDAIRLQDRRFGPLIENHPDVGGQAFLHHGYAQAILGILTTAAAEAGVPSPDADMVDELLLDCRFLNGLWRQSTDPADKLTYLVGTAFSPEHDVMRVKEAA